MLDRRPVFFFPKLALVVVVCLCTDVAPIHEDSGVITGLDPLVSEPPVVPEKESTQAC